MCSAYDGISQLHSHVITDGEKGLHDAVRDVLPNAYHAGCSFHRSLKLSNQSVTRPLFLSMARKNTLQQYQDARNALEASATDASNSTIDGVPVTQLVLSCAYSANHI